MPQIADWGDPAARVWTVAAMDAWGREVSQRTEMLQSICYIYIYVKYIYIQIQYVKLL